MGCALGHAPTTARGAKPAFLAGEGDEFFCLTVLALDPEESVSEYAAPEERFELFSQVFWQVFVLGFGVCFESS